MNAFGKNIPVVLLLRFLILQFQSQNPEIGPVLLLNKGSLKNILFDIKWHSVVCHTFEKFIGIKAVWTENLRFNLSITTHFYSD